MQISLKKMSFLRKKSSDSNVSSTNTLNDIMTDDSLETVTMTPTVMPQKKLSLPFLKKKSNDSSKTVTVTVANHDSLKNDAMTVANDISKTVMPQSVTLSSSVIDAKIHPPKTLKQRFVWLLHYIVTWGWVTDITRFMIEIGGNIAVSAFTLATVYVTLNTVAHRLVSWVIPNSNVITVLNQLSIIAFSVLPELVILAAMSVSWRHWRMAFATKRISSFFWAVSFSAPTVVFLYMTGLTISSFVSLEAISNQSPQATGGMLVARCFAGWTYSLVSMWYVKVGEESDSEIWTELNKKMKNASTVITQQMTVIEQQSVTMTQYEQNVTTLRNELNEIRLQYAMTAMSSRPMTQQKMVSKKKTQKAMTHRSVTVTPSSKSVTMTVANDSHDDNSESVTMTDDTALSVMTENTVIVEGVTNDNSATTEDDSAVIPETVIDDSQVSRTVTNAEKLSRLKEIMRDNILNNRGKKLPQIAAEADVVYGTARNNAAKIVAQLKSEGVSS